MEIFRLKKYSQLYYGKALASLRKLDGINLLKKYDKPFAIMILQLK